MRSLILPLLPLLIACTAPASADDTASPIDWGTDTTDEATICTVETAQKTCADSAFALGLLPGAMLLRLDQIDDDGIGTEIAATLSYLDISDEDQSRIELEADCDDGATVRATIIWCR